MPNGICRLCGKDGPLLLSHIIPAFAFRWLRESAGGGHLRSTKEVNQRVQDGEKHYWLCPACEELLGKSETQFATRLFHPYSEDSAVRIPYGPWLMRFAAGLVWRVVRFIRDQGPLTDFPDELVASMDRAEAAWKAVALGTQPHPGDFQIHMLPLDAIQSLQGGFAPNINRYLMRAIDMDLTQGGRANFVYVKLGRFIFLGFYGLQTPTMWKGTKLHANEGLAEPRKYVLPKAFGEYLNSRATHMAAKLDGMSTRQQGKVDSAFAENVDAYLDSDAWAAMSEDLRLFGDDAISKR